MYACFGFSLARSRRARMIDLQCQSLSLRRAFLLRSVCLSCMCVSVSRSLAHVEQRRSTCNASRYLSVELFCFAACVCHCTEPSRVMALAGRLTRKIKQKSSRNSIGNRSPETPRDPQNRRKLLPAPSPDIPWRPRASRRRLGSVSGASRSVPSALRECPEGHQERPGTPERAPWSAWERAEATKIDAKSRPGTKNSSCLGTVHSQTDFRSIFARFSIDFRMFAQVVRGALSRRNSINFRFELAKPDPHETLPIAMNSRVGPFEASRLTRAREP